jgi:hypothetical protein
MAAQLQFYLMQKAGMSYVMDPKQVVFTGNQYDIVHGVLNGEFDVGFVRTDTIERTTDMDGNLLDPDLFKIIEPKIYVLDDGNLFPFLHSTPIYPEWPFAALTHVPKDVAEEVQNALLALGKHAQAARALQDCRADLTELNGAICEFMSFPMDFDPTARCDTTKSIAELALEASQIGKYSGFRTTRSYFEVRSMQQEAGFISQDERGDWHCTRATSVYDGITCPPGNYKRSRQEYENGCNRVGLPCKEGYDCFCKPCVKAFEVDVYPYVEGETDYHLTDYYGDLMGGCEKMSLCGTLEQTKSLTLRAYDNKEREGINMTVLMHVGSRTEHFHLIRLPNTFAYEFVISEKLVGVEIIEISVNDEPIPESPIRVQVVVRDCALDTGESRVPDTEGTCVCTNNAIEVFGKCVSSIIFFIVISAVLLMVASGIVYCYLSHKKKENNNVWLVNVDDLHFTQPVEVIGQGSFGVVLLAEYRGTKVAVKRVLPQHEGATKSDSTEDLSVDLEAPAERPPAPGTCSAEINKRNKKGGSSSDNMMDILGSGSYQGSVSMIAQWCPRFFDTQSRRNDSILGSVSYAGGSTNRVSIWYQRCPRFDKQARQKEAFMNEMRVLSRLRHPCITTVMGAVISSVIEPMLVI